MKRGTHHRRAGFSPHGPHDMPAKAGTPIPWTKIFALLLGITLVFAPVLSNGFIAWDDQQEIYLNPDLNPVSWQKLKRNWTETEETVWMPLTYYAWGALAAIAPRTAGPNGATLSPAPFHAASLASHLFAVL